MAPRTLIKLADKPEDISFPVPAEEHCWDSELSSVTIEKPLLLSDVSSFNILKRLMAWILCFSHNTWTKENQQTPSLNSNDLQTSERLMSHHSQTECFSMEIIDLKKAKPLSILLHTTPLLTIRVLSKLADEWLMLIFHSSLAIPLFSIANIELER